MKSSKAITELKKAGFEVSENIGEHGGFVTAENSVCVVEFLVNAEGTVTKGKFSYENKSNGAVTTGMTLKQVLN